MEKEIKEIYNRNLQVKLKLEQSKSFSQALSVEKQLTVYLITTIGCYFENCFSDILMEYSKENSSDILNNVICKEFIYKKYHSFFVWDSQKPKGINTLLGKFGEDFSNQFKELINKDAKLKQSILTFLDLGNLRNLVSHVYLYEVEKTSNEVFKAFQDSTYFINEFKKQLNKHKICI